ncbi:restriction endonuclease subunit S [Deinococcus sp. Marseille-Q6407]|uniref:restriction endonuclease subunit S n=1 Tax=Deinococcus sp. Marseille-Q6407 TaxID=2969223 RepID=UPI0021BFA178|nr:restriction endonuclease subunit S [Deinococcus sp. Marseille-Q6407]
MPNNHHEWPTVTFGDVVQEITVHEREPETQGLDRYVGLDHLDPGDPRVRRWGLISEGVTFTKVFRAGQILFGKRRVYQKKMGVPNFDGLCSGDIIVLDTKDKRLSREFLALVVQTEAFFAHAEKTSSGSLSPRTKFRELAKFKFLLPPPEQQRELVELMQGFERAIEAGEGVAEAASKVQDLLLKNLSPRKPNVNTIDELSEHVTSGSRGWAAYYSGEGAHFVRIGDLKRRQLYPDLSETQKILAPNTKEADRTRLLENDILISVTADIGIVNLVPENVGEAYVNQHIAIVRLDRDKANPKFCAYFLRSPEGQKQLQMSNDSGIKAGINLQSIRRLKVNLPSAEKQSESVQRLDCAASLLKEHNAAQSNLRQLRFSILNTALTPSATAEAAAEVPA